MSLVFSAGLSRFGTASDSSFQCKSAHQETVLLRRYVTCFSGIPWPLETAVKGKAFINEYKTVTFPQKSFKSVGPCAAEEKKRAFFHGVQSVVKADDGLQSIDPLAKVRPTALSPHKDNAAYPHRIIILIFSKTVYFARLSKEKMRITY